MRYVGNIIQAVNTATTEYVELIAISFCILNLSSLCSLSFYLTKNLMTKSFDVCHYYHIRVKLQSMDNVY